MELKEALQRNGIKVISNGTDKSVTITSPHDVITTRQRIVAVNIPLTGLCSNCDQLGDCHWKTNNKIFCEHYQ